MCLLLLDGVIYGHCGLARVYGCIALRCVYWSTSPLYLLPPAVASFWEFERVVGICRYIRIYSLLTDVYLFEVFAPSFSVMCSHMLRT